jgi:hypothetical protein
MDNQNRKLGPNMKRLLSMFIARIAIPPGGGLAAGLALFTEPGRYQEVAREALKQTDIAITAMRAAPDKWYSDDEEEIAGIILASLEDTNDA